MLICPVHLSTKGGSNLRTISKRELSDSLGSNRDNASGFEPHADVAPKAPVRNQREIDSKSGTCLLCPLALPPHFATKSLLCVQQLPCRSINKKVRISF
jgi:hypothetical protein